ncbi:MAG TPA: tripartite tricarboxylate transporter substrate binding protein [Thermodesulfobacteriota bacterium]|nr:tripartite tricarboxylate transporter substrate binding protein [Thermodesulfobacteriota bacterium]
MAKKMLIALFLAGFMLNLASAGVCAPRGEGDKYPTKPINYLVVWDPGGQSDRTARLQQPQLEKMLGQKIVIDYKVGGGGAVGWAQFVRARPDGYSIVGTNLPTIVTQPMMQDVGYRTDQFVPICDFQYTPLVMVVKKDSPYKSLKDFLAAAKADPGKRSVGGVALWSITHILYLNLTKEAKVEAQFVPHTGSASLVSNILGGHVDVGVIYTDDMIRLGDQIRVLAVATPEKFPGREDAPTFKEQGFNYDAGVSRGVALPAGSPEYAVKKLEKAFVEITKSPEYVKTMVSQGFVPRVMNAEQFKAEIARQKAFWAEALKGADIKKEAPKK